MPWAPGCVLDCGSQTPTEAPHLPLEWGLTLWPQEGSQHGWTLFSTASPGALRSPLYRCEAEEQNSEGLRLKPAQGVTPGCVWFRSSALHGIPQSRARVPLGERKAELPPSQPGVECESCPFLGGSLALVLKTYLWHISVALLMSGR
ncbi:hypothetical protein VULLAG_LOCUS22961 [Vulpes lagopus]